MTNRQAVLARLHEAVDKFPVVKGTVKVKMFIRSEGPEASELGIVIEIDDGRVLVQDLGCATWTDTLFGIVE